MKISLTQKQQAFLNAMLVSKTTDEAIEEAGIHRSTAYKYLNDDEWKKEYRKQRNALTDGLTNQLQQLGTQAIRTLEENLNDPEATPASKNTTAKTILDYIYSNYDREQIIERLEEIERALAEQGGD